MNMLIKTHTLTYTHTLTLIHTNLHTLHQTHATRSGFNQRETMLYQEDDFHQPEIRARVPCSRLWASLALSFVYISYWTWPEDHAMDRWWETSPEMPTCFSISVCFMVLTQLEAWHSPHLHGSVTEHVMQELLWSLTRLEEKQSQPLAPFSLEKGGPLCCHVMLLSGSLSGRTWLRGGWGDEGLPSCDISGIESPGFHDQRDGDRRVEKERAACWTIMKFLDQI